MREQTSRRMWMNLAKGVACLVAGAVVIAAIEVLWDHASAGEWPHFAEGSHKPGKGDSPPEDPDYRDMMSFVFEDESEAVGLRDLPERFIEECFDAGKLGDARCSADGGVIGVTSKVPAPELFDACARELTGNGWLQVESGYPLRCTFLKESGSFRWLFLDVNQVSESGVAVFVVEEGEGS